MSAWQPLLDFRPEQCWGEQARPHGAAVTQGHAERGTGPGPLLKSPGSLLPSATSSLQAFPASLPLRKPVLQPGGPGALEKSQPSL